VRDTKARRSNFMGGLPRRCDHRSRQLSHNPTTPRYRFSTGAMCRTGSVTAQKAGVIRLVADDSLARRPIKPADRASATRLVEIGLSIRTGSRRDPHRRVAIIEAAGRARRADQSAEVRRRLLRGYWAAPLWARLPITRFPLFWTSLTSLWIDCRAAGHCSRKKINAALGHRGYTESGSGGNRMRACTFA
jgi:hypothetical protein